MRFLILTLILFSAQPALAADTAKLSQDPVRIETDQERKAFLFILDDEPVAILNKAGLHVGSDINYSDVMVDKGPDALPHAFNALRVKEADDE